MAPRGGREYGLPSPPPRIPTPAEEGDWNDTKTAYRKRSPKSPRGPGIPRISDVTRFRSAGFHRVPGWIIRTPASAPDVPAWAGRPFNSQPDGCPLTTSPKVVGGCDLTSRLRYSRRQGYESPLTLDFDGFLSFAGVLEYTHETAALLSGSYLPF